MTHQRGVHIASEFPTGSQTLTQADWDKFKENKLDHIRLPFKPVEMFTSTAYTTFNTAYKGRYDAIVTAALANGLSVIIDAHDIGADVADSYAGIAAIWTSMGNAYKTRPVAQDKHDPYSTQDRIGVYFELFNEPQESDSGSWNDHYDDAIAAVRATGATQWLILDSMYGGDPNGFDPVGPRDDVDSGGTPVARELMKIIYSFHEYNPFEFTHCGAGFSGYDNVQAVRYEIDPDQVDRKLAAASINQYSDARVLGYNRFTMLQQIIDHPLTWAQKYNVGLYCGEGGFYNQFTLLADGYLWTKDYIWVMSQCGIGYALFVYGAPEVQYGPSPIFPVDDTMLGYVKANAELKRVSAGYSSGDAYVIEDLGAGVNLNGQAIYNNYRPVDDRNGFPVKLTVNNGQVTPTNSIPTHQGNGSYDQGQRGVQFINVSITLLSANPKRKMLAIQNPHGTASVWLRFAPVDATKDAYSWKLGPGDYWPKFPCVVYKGEIRAITNGTDIAPDDYHQLQVIEA